MEKKPYVLPQLEFGYKELEPYISEAQLQLHHQKHHAAYVNGANAILETLDKNRRDGVDGDAKALAKAFSFNAAGHLLHALFWENLAPAAKTTPKPAGAIRQGSSTPNSAVSSASRKSSARPRSAPKARAGRRWSIAARPTGRC